MRAEALKHNGGAPVVYYQRWPAIWRIAHLVFAVCIVVLVLTGMTLLNADTTWAPIISNMFGGPRISGNVHRIFAVGFLAVLWHLVYVSMLIARNWKTFRWFGPDLRFPA